MTRSCTCGVSASTWRLPAGDLKCVLQMWDTGWQQTDSSWTLTRRSSSGLVLSPVKHVGTTSSSCFYWLRQIRGIRRSLDAESAKTLVHAFITSLIDGCNTVLARSPRTITVRLQRLLNAAARVVSDTGKFNRGLTHLLHSELHWLDVPQRIFHKLGVTVHRCLLGKAPQYPVHCCHPTSDVASRQRVRSSSCHHGRTTTSSQHAWPSGVLRCQSDGLECTAWRPPRPVAQYWQFQEDSKDASVSECTWTLSALVALRNALYKFKTYLLTYEEKWLYHLRIRCIHIKCTADVAGTSKVKRSKVKFTKHILTMYQKSRLLNEW